MARGLSGRTPGETYSRGDTIDDKIVLEATDFLSVTSSLANSADVIVSVLELT